MSWSTIVAGGTPYDESQAMPSCTRSTRRKYAPRTSGDVTGSDTTTFWPGPTSLGRAARAPSHTTTDPSAPIQWYETWTGFGPAAGHAAAPVFATVRVKAFAPRMNVDWVLAVGA